MELDQKWIGVETDQVGDRTREADENHPITASTCADRPIARLLRDTSLATLSLEVETLFATIPFQLPMCPHKGGIGLKAVDDIADQGGELHPMRPK
eukprot:scaffold7099_cov281-Pinguiococcus_pyrenoidosus.AAC.11